MGRSNYLNSFELGLGIGRVNPMDTEIEVKCLIKL